MRDAVLRWTPLVTLVALVVGGGVAGLTAFDPEAVAAATGACARGYEPVNDALKEVRSEMRTEMRTERGTESEEAEHEGEEGEEGEHESELAREAVREIPVLEGTDPDEWDSLCIIARRPESLKELTSLFGTQAMSRVAPYGSYKEGAAVAAVRQADRVRSLRVAGTSGTAAAYGKGPLIVDSPDYPEVNGLGLHKNSGRVDSYAYDPAGKRLFAAVGTGGIWRSDDLGGSWRNASGNLPDHGHRCRGLVEGAGRDAPRPDRGADVRLQRLHRPRRLLVRRPRQDLDALEGCPAGRAGLRARGRPGAPAAGVRRDAARAVRVP